MMIGIIGVGMVGGALKRWFEKNTDHHLRLRDPAFELDDDLTGCDAIFICIPVHPNHHGQDLTAIYSVIQDAKKYTSNIFIRSTVLPGTNDNFGTIAAPEFLTARFADDDMNTLPIVVGSVDKAFAQRIFPGKQIIQVSNEEAELAKFTHNCFGALKVTYFNMINKMCRHRRIDYNNVLLAGNITGFLGQQHTQVPGHDGHYGYGGTCFPPNMKALHGHLKTMDERTDFVSFHKEASVIEKIMDLNKEYRNEK